MTATRAPARSPLDTSGSSPNQDPIVGALIVRTAMRWTPICRSSQVPTKMKGTWRPGVLTTGSTTVVDAEIDSYVG